MGVSPKICFNEQTARSSLALLCKVQTCVPSLEYSYCTGEEVLSPVATDLGGTATARGAGGLRSICYAG